MDSGDVTRLLIAYREGDEQALERLLPIVYDDLRRIARVHMRRSGPRQTLDATGLVHEVYLRLIDQDQAGYQDRQHFLSVCARAMRQILIDRARQRAAAKRGGGERAVTLDEQIAATDPDQAEWLLELDRALERLAGHHERLARVFECRFFGGLNEQETADALGASLRTVQRDWMRARAWLRDYLGEPTS